MSSTHYILECRNLDRELPPPDNRLLLRNISFAVDAAEVLAVVGPSGAGKSSLLRLLNRLDEPSQGTVFLHGRDYREMPVQRLRRTIGMVGQRAFLFPENVVTNIAYGPAQQGRAIAREQIEEMLAHVGLRGYVDRDVRTLSGGEAQRVAITRALANDPEILLLDEPTSALDEAARDDVQQLLSSLIRERRLTCIWVTHSPEQARAMADRVLALRAGEIEAIGTPTEVLRA